MTKRTRNLILGIIGIFILLNLISIGIKMYSDNQSPVGNIAGNLNTSTTSVSIDSQLIPSYDFKNSVYISAQDLQLFGFELSFDEEKHTVNITDNGVRGTNEEYRSKLSNINENAKVFYPTELVYLNGTQVVSYTTEEYILLPVNVLNNIGSCTKEADSNTIVCLLNKNAVKDGSDTDSEEGFSLTPPTAEPGSAVITPAPDNQTSQPSASTTTTTGNGKIIVLDPGHGKSSSAMTDAEKESSGWVRNSSGAWGEWRHWKSHTTWSDCLGTGCSGRVPANGGCWYPIGNGDRATEPELTLNNALAAKKYLEQMGYTVRMARSSNDENPSITKRIASCYPNSDTSKAPDADAYICIHSNAGGGRGSCYISLSGTYDQSGIPADYVTAGNELGKTINDCIVANTSLSAAAGGRYDALPELILFCKSPVLTAYLEIGFYDNASDLNILRTESDMIGKSIAQGIDTYMQNH